MASNGGGGGGGDDPLVVGDESDDSYDPQYEEEEDDGDEYSDEGSPEDLTLRIDEAMAPGEALLDEMMGPLRHSLAEQERSGEGRVVAQLMSEEEEEEEEEDEERGGGEVGVSEVGSSEGRRMRVEDETAVWEYEADCSVCMEPWTEEGRHQSCSLACGHTFGRSCIEKWISGCKKNICPKCKKRCKLSDIRPIYPKRVAVIDKVLEKELDIIRTENRLLWMEVKNKATMLQNANSEIERMRKEMEKMANEAQERKSDLCCEVMSHEGRRKRLFGAYDERNGLQSDFAFETIKCNQRDPPCRFRLKQEFWVDGARVFDMDAFSDIMLLSRRLYGIDGGCVLSKISLLDPSESENIPLPPTHKAIRDLCISQRPDKLALMASLGKKLSIFSWQSNNLVHTYDLPAPAWSCAWDVNNVHHAYGGLQNGMLVMFDLRQTAYPVALINGISNLPVHTLHSVQSDGRQSAARTIIGGSASGLCKWNVLDADIKSVSYLIPNMEKEGVCISLAHCASSNDMVAMYRQRVQTDNASQPGISPASFPGSPTLGSHVYIKQEEGSAFNAHEPKSLYVSEVRMPKSAIISVENSCSVFAYGDDRTHTVVVKELPSLDFVNGLRPHERRILDVKCAPSSNSSLLGCISENRAQVFSVFS